METLEKETAYEVGFARYVGEFTVSAGTYTDVDTRGFSVSVEVFPGAGGTATLMHSNSPWPDIDGGSGRWIDSGKGEMGDPTPLFLASESDAAAIRLTATTADATFVVSGQKRHLRLG